MAARRTPCAAALALAACGVSTARAVPSYDIPVECGSRQAFDAALRERLGDDAPTSSVQLSIVTAADRSHLRVQVGGEVRELDDPSCQELFRASVVVAVAMLLKDSPSPPPPAALPPPPVSAVPGARPQLTVGAGAGLNVGTLPKPVLTLELEGKALWQDVGLSASLRYLLPAQQLDENAQGAALSGLGGGVSGIFRPSRPWEARLGFAAQRLSGRGMGTDRQYSAGVWAAGPTLGLNLTLLRTRGLWVAAGTEGQLNLLRGRFEILNYSRDLTAPPHVVHRVPWVAGTAFVRAGLSW